MDKSPDAFRTISEVAEVLDTPAHVLRFWESRFPQIRPVKRAGGRRYYRPADMALLTGIKHLLHDEGMTIRGVQKVLREQGVRYVAGLSGHDVPDETEDAEAALEAALAANFGPADDTQAPQDEVESAQILALETALRPRDLPSEGASLPPAEVVTLFDTPAPPVIAEPAPADLSFDTPIESDAETAEEATMLDLTMDAAVDAPGVEYLGIEDIARETSAPGENAVDLAPTTAPDAPQIPEAAHWLDPELEQDAPRAADLPLPDLPLIDRLRALPPGSLADTAKAAALRDRLAALAARVATPPPQAPL